MRITKSKLRRLIEQEMNSLDDDQKNEWWDEWKVSFEAWWKKHSEEISSLNPNDQAKLAYQAGFYEGKK